MKLEDILTLVKAGYTREEIDKLETPEAPAGHTAPPSETPDTPKPAEAHVAPPAKAPEEAPKPAAPAKAPETPKPEATSNDQVLGAINALTAAIQKMNVQNASIPGGDEELTPEDMIASIINPPMKPKGGK